MKKVLREFRVESHIEVVPNGVDLKRFHSATAALPRADFGFTEKDILLSTRVALHLKKISNSCCNHLQASRK